MPLGHDMGISPGTTTGSSRRGFAVAYGLNPPGARARTLYPYRPMVLPVYELSLAGLFSDSAAALSQD